MYSHSDSATSGDVTLKVEWNDPVLGQPTTFHVSATGGSGIYKFNMEAPSYTNPDVTAYESVADPSRGEWTKYSDECTSQDYAFTMMASGTYNFRFHVMDIKAGVTYLRTNTYIQVSSSDYPSVNSIVQSAVAQCNNETDGSDYQKALWLHDWLLNQLEYDNSLKWSSAESALTRCLGTCQAYERAYAQLLSAAGIENAETRDTYDGHTWNAMKLDGEWYQVDCTWNDSKDNWYNFDQRRLYFGLTDELMAIAHPGYSNIYTTEGYNVRSTSLKNNYFVKNGEAQQWADSYKDRIQNSLNSKQTQFSIQADNSTYPPSIYKIQNGIIAYVMNQNEWFVDGKKVSLVATVNDKQFDFNVTYPIECTKHDWNEFEVTTEPTCTKDGIKTYTCKNCSTTKTETIKALGHDYSSKWTTDKEATCTQEGSKSHHCIRCDDKKDVTVISQSDHHFDNGVITKQATTTETGIKTYTCQNCKATKTEIIPIIKNKDTVDSEAPVIDVNSINFSTKLATTGDTVKISLKITDNIGVDRACIQLINYETNRIIGWTNLTYNEITGLYEYSLEITDAISNGHWYIDNIQAYDTVNNVSMESFKRNEYGFIVSNTKADSETPVIDVNSIKLSTKSATTGDTVKISIKITDNVSVDKAYIQLINYDTGKIIGWTNLTFNETTGLYEYSMEITDAVPNGHWYVYGIQAYDAVNNVSMESFRNYEHLFVVTRNNADVHKWNNGTILQQPTCTKIGEKIFECLVCHETKTETIKALGHDYSNEWTIDKEATCTEEGSKSHHCTRCDEKKDVARIEKLNHSWKLTSTIESTKDKEGKNIYTCSLCNEKREEVIPKLIGKWVTNNSGKWFGYPDGTYENTGFKKINEDTYYFQSNGYVKTGWLSDNGVWYYFNKDGIMQTGWSGPGRQYYFDDAGKMLEKQFTPDGYYVGSSGAYVRNGWVLNNGKYYYMNGSGKMVKCSWVGSYYLGSDGVMITNKWVQWNGKYYYLDSQGVYVKNKWIGSYYLSSNGVMATNRWVGNYWCGSDGQYVKSSWVDNNRYYVNNKGLYVVGSWQKDSVGWYYRVGNDYAKNITLNINGLAYKFDSRGYWVS